MKAVRHFFGLGEGLPDEKTCAEMVSTTVFAVIDCQTYFCNPSLEHRRPREYQAVQRTAFRINRMQSAFRQAGFPIVFIKTQSWAFNANDPEMDYFAVRPEPGDIEWWKHSASAMRSFSLEKGCRLGDVFRAASIRRIIDTGFWTDMCLSANAEDQISQDFDVAVIPGLTDVHPRTGRKAKREALADLGRQGVHITPLKEWQRFLDYFVRLRGAVAVKSPQALSQDLILEAK